jgi:tripartite-type tricarboxylate transporter receptor subunit TctC
MSVMQRRELLISVFFSSMPWAAHSQGSYPTKAIQLAHGFGAGGNADVIARTIGVKLQELLRQPVVVDIKSGAGGLIASNSIAKAAPDGYSIVLLTGAHTVSAALKKNLPFDPVKDFSFISTVTNFPFVIAVRSDHPAKTLTELLSFAKNAPGKTTFTSVGVGSTQHIVGELLSSSGGVELLHTPYRGGGAPVTAVLSGDVDILIDTLTVATPHINSGKLRPLAVTSQSFWPTLPAVQPVALTLAGFEVRSWLGLAAPAGTADPIISRLNAEVGKVLKDPDVIKVIASSGSLAAPSSPQEMRLMVQNEIVRWKSVISKSGIPLQD